MPNIGHPDLLFGCDQRPPEFQCNLKEVWPWRLMRSVHQARCAPRRRPSCSGELWCERSMQRCWSASRCAPLQNPHGTPAQLRLSTAAARQSVIACQGGKETPSAVCHCNLPALTCRARATADAERHGRPERRGRDVYKQLMHAGPSSSICSMLAPAAAVPSGAQGGCGGTGAPRHRGHRQVAEDREGGGGGGIRGVELGAPRRGARQPSPAVAPGACLQVPHSPPLPPFPPFLPDA